MSGYFQRLVARAGGGVSPAPPLPPTLPSWPHVADETDPFQNVAEPEPTGDRTEDGVPRGAARATLAARLADEIPQRLVPDEHGESAEQPTIPASVSPGNPVAAEPAERLPASVSPGNPVVAEPAERLPDQASARAQESVASPRLPGSLAPARTDVRQERAPELEQRRQDAYPEPLSPEKSVETRVIQTRTVERIVERLDKRALAPRDGFADTPPHGPPPSRGERPPPSPVVKLAPRPLSEEPADARTPDEPRLVIGRLQVDVMSPPAPAPTTTRVITRETPARPRTDGRASNLRFGLGQI